MNVLKNNISKLSALFIIVVSLVVITGWICDVPAVSSIFPGSVSMKFNTALCFILAGAALFIYHQPVVTTVKKRLAVVCAWVVFITGLLTFVQYFFGWGHGIDGLFFPGHMSMISSLNLVLFGLALLLIERRWFHWPIQMLCIFIIAAAVLVMLNYFFGASFLSFIPQLGKTAVLTAVLFLVLSISLFFAPPLRSPTFSVTRKIACYFIACILTLAFIFFAVNKKAELDVATNDWVLQNRDILLLDHELLNRVADMETATGGFITSGKAYFLDLFNESAAGIRNSLEKIKVLTKGNASQQQLADSLERLAIAAISRKAQLIRLRKEGTSNLAGRLFTSGESGKDLEQLRLLVTRRVQENERLLAARKAANLQAVRESSRVINVFKLVTVVLLITAFTVIYRNIRARNEAEEALIASNKRFATIFDLSPAALSITAAADGKFLYVNDAFCAKLGYEKAAVIGKKITDVQIINSGQRAKIAKRIEQAGGRLKDFEIKVRKATGENMDAFYSVEKIVIDNRACWVTALFDISERKKAEEEIIQLNSTLERRVLIRTNEILEKEKRYKDTLDGMMEGVQILDFDYRFVYVNDAAASNNRRQRQELIGRTVMEIFPGIRHTGVFQRIQRCMKDRTASRLEDEFRFPDNSVGFYQMSFQPLPEGVLILSADITERKKLQQALEEQQLRQQQLMTELAIEAEEKQRNELGRELHDNVNQVLATIKIYLGMLKTKHEMDKNLLDLSYNNVTTAMNEIRKLSHSLVSPSLGGNSLLKVLEKMVAEINAGGLLQMQLKYEIPETVAANEKMNLMLYRIIQEQVTNIYKHAGAKKARITLKIIGENLFLSVTDDGAGYDTESILGGIGLKNISNRVAVYSGSFAIISSPGYGCTLKVNIPLKTVLYAKNFTG